MKTGELLFIWHKDHIASCVKNNWADFFDSNVFNYLIHLAYPHPFYQLVGDIFQEKKNAEGIFILK